MNRTGPTSGGHYAPNFNAGEIMMRAGICLGLTFALTAMAGTSTQPSEHNRTEMQNPKAKLSKEVSQVLICTEHARTAIAQHNRQLATKDVDQGLNDANSAV